MMFEPGDQPKHGRPVWVVFGSEGQPRIMCAKLFAYDEQHQVLPVGQRGATVCI